MATTTTDIAVLHRRALESTRTFVVGIGSDQWAAATPCEGWTVRELLNHIVAGNLWAAELATGRTIADVGSALDGDMVGSNRSRCLRRVGRSSGARVRGSRRARRAVRRVVWTCSRVGLRRPSLPRRADPRLGSGDGDGSTERSRSSARRGLLGGRPAAVVDAAGQWHVRCRGRERCDSNPQARLLAALGR